MGCTVVGIQLVSPSGLHFRGFFYMVWEGERNKRDRHRFVGRIHDCRSRLVDRHNPAALKSPPQQVDLTGTTPVSSSTSTPISIPSRQSSSTHKLIGELALSNSYFNSNSKNPSTRACRGHGMHSSQEDSVFVMPHQSRAPVGTRCTRGLWSHSISML